MNKTILSISFILLSISVNATLIGVKEPETIQEIEAPRISDRNQLNLKLHKRFGFLWIFKYADFVWELVSKGEAADRAPTWNTSLWYFWSGYFEKFVAQTYQVEIQNIVDEVAEEYKQINFSEVNNVWVADYHIPTACEQTAEVALEVVDNGWEKNTKRYLVKYICNKKHEALVQQELDEQLTKDSIKPEVHNEDEQFNSEPSSKVSSQVNAQEKKMVSLFKKIVNEKVISKLYKDDQAASLHNSQVPVESNTMSSLIKEGIQQNLNAELQKQPSIIQQDDTELVQELSSKKLKIVTDEDEDVLKDLNKVFL